MDKAYGQNTATNRYISFAIRCIARSLSNLFAKQLSSRYTFFSACFVKVIVHVITAFSHIAYCVNKLTEWRWKYSGMWLGEEFPTFRRIVMHSSSGTVRPWRWRQYDISKGRELLAWHGVTPQKIWIFNNVAAMRTSKVSSTYDHLKTPASVTKTCFN